MTNLDQIELLRQIRILHEWYYPLSVSVESLRRLARENGYGGLLADLEKAVSKETDPIHADMLRLIDERIQKVSHGL